MGTITAVSAPRARPGEAIALEPGDHLDRVTFHDRYQRMPEHVRAELVEGIVYMPSPTKRRHGRPASLVSAWLTAYEIATPGVEGLAETTLKLGEFGEPQPDACLRICNEDRGRSHVDEEDFVAGPPELVVEVASSSVSIDLHAKRRDYERYGVQEYLMVLVRERRVLWFGRRNEAFVELAPNSDGSFGSRVFPGLRLDVSALLRGDAAALLAGVQAGVECPEHAAFVKRLTGAGGAVPE